MVRLYMVQPMVQLTRTSAPTSSRDIADVSSHKFSVQFSLRMMGCLPILSLVAVYGQLSTFNSSEDDWQSYTERLQFYFTANDIVTEKRRVILYTQCMWCSYLQKDQEPCSTVEANV